MKSVSEEASLGISQASIVDDDDKLQERVRFIHQSVGTGALVERYVEGRELYVGVMGNHRLQVFPVWELDMSRLPEDASKIATARVKWSRVYQQKYGVRSNAAGDLTESQRQIFQSLAKRVYRSLGLSGYARIDFRLDPAGQVYVLEANPNPAYRNGRGFCFVQPQARHFRIRAAADAFSIWAFVGIRTSPRPTERLRSRVESVKDRTTSPRLEVKNRQRW